MSNPSVFDIQIHLQATSYLNYKYEIVLAEKTKVTVYANQDKSLSELQITLCGDYSIVLSL
jgi:hypothetical protein